MQNTPDGRDKLALAVLAGRFQLIAQLLKQNTDCTGMLLAIFRDISNCPMCKTVGLDHNDNPKCHECWITAKGRMMHAACDDFGYRLGCDQMRVVFHKHRAQTIFQRFLLALQTTGGATNAGMIAGTIASRLKHAASCGPFENSPLDDYEGLIY